MYMQVAYSLSLSLSLSPSQVTHTHTHTHTQDASDPPSLDSYYAYLSHLSTTKDDPTTINTLYQRAIAHHCLDLDLWKHYLKFLVCSLSLSLSLFLSLSVNVCSYSRPSFIDRRSTSKELVQFHCQVMSKPQGIVPGW